MIVCLCSCVSESDIIEEIKKGFTTVDALADRLNVTNVCGTCLLEVERLLVKLAKVDSTIPPSLQFVKIIGPKQ